MDNDAPPSPPPLEREPKKRAPRKKPDLSGVDPAEITIQTKGGAKTFSARSRPKAAVAAPEPSLIPANPWSSELNSWVD